MCVAGAGLVVGLGMMGMIIGTACVQSKRRVFVLDVWLKLDSEDIVDRRCCSGLRAKSLSRVLYPR